MHTRLWWNWKPGRQGPIFHLAFTTQILDRMAKREQNSEANINSSCKVNHKDATLISGKRHQGHNDHYSTSNIPSRKLREHHNPTAHTPPPSQHPSQPTQPKLLTIQIRLLKPTPGSMMEQDLDKVTTILEGKSSNERPPPRKKSRLFFRLRVRGRKKHDSKCSLSLIRSPAAARVTCWRALPPRPAARCWPWCGT